MFDLAMSPEEMHKEIHKEMHKEMQSAILFSSRKCTSKIED